MSGKSGSIDRRHFLGGATMAAGLATLVQQPADAQAAAPSTPPAAAAPPTAPPGTAVLRNTPLADVEGKVAFISGATSGIGLGQARVFHNAGMKVAIGYIRDDQRAAAEKMFAAGAERVHFIKADVTDRAQMAAAADEVERVFGKVHLVSANAGVGMPASVANATYGDYDWCLAVNLHGVFNTIHEFLPRVRKHGEGGHFVATSSMSGVLPVTNGGAGIYTVTKFGVLAMMEGLRAELDARKEPIGVSCYLPGFVNTSIGELDRNRTGQFAGQTTQGARAPAGNRPAQAPAAAQQRAPGTGPGMDPVEAGERVLAAIRTNDLFIFSHSEFYWGIEERNEAIIASVPTDPYPPERGAASAFTRVNALYPAERDHMRSKNPRPQAKKPA